MKLSGFQSTVLTICHTILAEAVGLYLCCLLGWQLLTSTGATQQSTYRATMSCVIQQSPSVHWDAAPPLAHAVHQCHLWSGLIRWPAVRSTELNVSDVINVTRTEHDGQPPGKLLRPTSRILHAQTQA